MQAFCVHKFCCCAGFLSELIFLLVPAAAGEGKQVIVTCAKSPDPSAILLDVGLDSSVSPRRTNTHPYTRLIQYIAHIYTPRSLSFDLHPDVKARE